MVYSSFGKESCAGPFDKKIENASVKLPTSCNYKVN